MYRPIPNTPRQRVGSGFSCKIEQQCDREWWGILKMIGNTENLPVLYLHASFCWTWENETCCDNGLYLFFQVAFQIFHPRRNVNGDCDDDVQVIDYDDHLCVCNWSKNWNALSIQISTITLLNNNKLLHSTFVVKVLTLMVILCGVVNPWNKF